MREDGYFAIIECPMSSCLPTYKVVWLTTYKGRMDMELKADEFSLSTVVLWIHEAVFSLGSIIREETGDHLQFLPRLPAESQNGIPHPPIIRFWIP